MFGLGLPELIIIVVIIIVFIYHDFSLRVLSIPFKFILYPIYIVFIKKRSGANDMATNDKYTCEGCCAHWSSEQIGDKMLCPECGNTLSFFVSEKTIECHEREIDKRKNATEVTRILLANAHLNNDAIFSHIVERNEKRHKAATPEFYLDFEAIADECYKGRWREVIRYIMLIPLAIYGFFNLESGRFIIAIFIAWIIELTVDISRKNYVRKRFLSSNFDPDKLKSKSIQDVNQNIVISGGYSPFVGAGIDIHGWSFTIDLTKPDNKDEPIGELEINELYNEVTAAIESLSIPNIAINDKLFINGMDIRLDKRFLPNIMKSPVITVSQDIINNYIGKNDEKIRHYRVVQIPAWNGQLVLSIFFRFTKIGECLFSEVKFFLLTPLKEDFLSVDSMTRNISFKQFSSIVIFSLLKAPFTWISSFIWVLQKINNMQEAILGDEDKKLKKENERYNYGYNQSLREIWASGNYVRYFQMLDKDMYLKVVQQKLIDSITESLELRGISTETIKERGTQIFNSGVMVTGGKIEADSLAVGEGASVTSSFAKTTRNIQNAIHKTTHKK